MAISTVPTVQLDTRDGSELAAQALGALPQELSDRGPSNPAVPIIEACGYIVDHDLYQINNFPSSVIAKVLNLCGTTLESSAAATVQQTFNLTNPRNVDTVIEAGTDVSTSDGTIVFSTTADATITAYTAPAGTIAFTVGSATVAGTGTSFPTDTTWNGYKIGIQGASGSDPATWYTLANYDAGAGDSATQRRITTTAAATVATAAFFVGPITATAAARATTTGSDTNVGAATLTVMVDSVTGITSTSNAAAASGGQDEEDIDTAEARAQTTFAARDIALTANDYGFFAARTLGTGGRAMARENTNVTTASSGYVTVACLSPTWTAATPATAVERAAVVRDLATRTFSGTTTVDVAANIQTFTPVIAFWRKAAFDSTTARVAVAGAINTYLSPNTYEWGRSIYTTDMVQVVEAVTSVDRVVSLNGAVAFGTSSSTSAATAAFALGSASVTAVGGADYAAITVTQNWFVIAPDSKAYLIIDKSGGNAFTLDRVYEGSNSTATFTYFQSTDTALANWYSLGYSALSVSTASPAATVIVQGSV